VYKEGFLLIAIAATLWIIGHLLLVLDKRFVRIHYFTFTFFMLLLSIGIWKLTKAAVLTGLGK
jgi:hypothetical protein